MSDQSPDRAPDRAAAPAPALAAERAGEPASAAPARSRLGWLAPLFLALLSVAIYAPTLEYKLVYDDAFLITANSMMNPAKTSLTGAFTLFAHEYWEGVNSDQPDVQHERGQALYRPLTLFLWAVIVNVSGTTPEWPFHLLSILCNALVVVLLHQLVCRLWGKPVVAFVAALLFALHPLHSEAVAYVAGASDLVSTAAVFLGLIFWERATSRPGVLGRGAFVGLLITLFLGLLAKEQAVVLVAAIAVTDVMCAWRGDRRGGVPRGAVYCGLVATLAAHILMRVAVLGNLTPSDHAIAPLDNPLINQPFLVRLFTGAKIMAMQVWLFLFPDKLSIDYSLNAIPVERTIGTPAVLIGAILMLLLLLYGLVMLRRRPAVGWGVLLFLGCALFTSSILVPIGTIFGERLMYLSSAGACIAVAALLEPLLPGRRGAAGGATALGLVAVLAAAGLLGMRTWERNKDFATSERLFESALEVVPQSARVHFQLGALYARQKLYTKAAESYERSLRIDTTFIQAAIGLADTHTAARNWDEAIELYDKMLGTIVASPTGSQDTVNSVQRLIYMKRAGARAGKGDLEGSTADLRTALQFGAADPKQGVSAHVQLAQLQLDRGKTSDAIGVLQQALKIEPKNLGALYMLARAAFKIDDTEAYKQALDGLEQTDGGRSLALAMKGESLYNEAVTENDNVKRQKAIDMFEEVREANPELGTPYIFRSRFMFENGRYKDAILEADLALQRAPRHPTALLLKAMAQNAAELPDEALATAQELALIDPSEDCYKVMATAHEKMGDLDALEADYAKLKAMGSEPVEIILSRAIAFESRGRIDEAIAAIEQGRLVSDNSRDTRLLRSLGALLIDAERYDEALATFQQQDVIERSTPDTQPDRFLPVNRARALMGLGRDVEAAAELELFASSITSDSPAWISLLHRRAELFLRTGGPFYDPAAASDLCDQGLVLTNNRYPDLLDTSIEALVASGQVEAALERAKLAVAQFPEEPRFGVVLEALDKAQAGNTAGAVAQLRKSKEKALRRIADKLQG